MIELNQITILQRVSKRQENILKGLIGECHANGNTYVRKLNKEFADKQAMEAFKISICSQLCLDDWNMSLIYTEK